MDELEAAKQEALEAAKAKATSLAGKTTSHASNGEHKVPFHVHFPKSYDGSKKLPLLILFSPGGNGKDMINKFKEAAESMEWVLVGCDKAANSWVDKDTDVLQDHKCKVRKFEFTGGHAVGPTEVLLDAMKWIVDEQE